MCPPPGHKGQMIPCVVCMTPVASDAGQVQVKLALNSVDFSTASAPFVFMDLFPVRTHRSEFAWRSLSDNLADNQRFVDEEGQQITPGDVPELEEALTEFYGEFYGAVDTMSRATPPEYAFYDGLYSFYSTGAVATDMAEVCITAMRPSTGPAEGGTTVQVKVQGSIPFGHADFYCVFRQTMQIIRVTSAAYDSEDDSIVLTCTMPPGDERSINYVGISLDGKATSPLGAPFYYHSDLELSSISPSSGPSHGGTTVTVTFAESQVLPSGTDSDVVHASCRFSYVSSSGVTTTKATAGVYSPAIGSVHATVACVTPGFSVEIPSGDISVAVSLNGAEYGTSQLNHTGVRYTLTSSETLSADQIPYMGFYGLELLQPPLIDSSGPSEAGTTYPEQALVEVSEVGSAPFVSFSYSTARCLTYLQTSIATLDGLLVEGDLVLPDYSTKGYSTDVAPEFQTGLLDYTALVPYQLYNGFSLSGNTSDRFSNMFVHGQPVPRLGRSVVTAHNSTGDATSVELTVLSSDSSTSLTYAVTVLRDLPGTEDGVADLAITGATGRDAGISPAWNSTVYSGYSVRVRFLNSVWLLFAPSMVDRYAKATVSDNSTGSSETVGFKMPSTHANLTLPVGFTLVTVTGVSEGGVISSTSVYEILVERVEAMTVSTVELVTITTLYPEAGGNLLSPSPWDPATTDYTLTLIYPEDEVTFQVLTTDDAQATTASMNNGTDVDVEYNGTYFATGIEVGTNTLLLTSVAEDGVNTTVYNITIIRLAKSSDATLSDLYTEACSDDTQGQLEPNFTSSTYMYDAVVPHQCANDAFYDRLLGTMSNSQDITLTPVCSYYFCSSISVALPNGVTLSGSNGTSFVVDIPTATRNGLTKDASSMVNVTVTAEDETTTATYYLNVTRLARSTIAGLLNMTIDGGSNSLYPTSGVLYQGHWGGAVGFNGSVSRYFMEVESEVSTLTVGTENNQMFAVTTVELNPSAAGSNSTGAEAIITNSTGNSVRALVSGSNNTVRIRVHSEAFQPSQKFAYYSPTAYAEYIITVFRRTKSTSAVLKDLSVAVGSLAEIPTVRLGAHVSLSRNFSSTVLSYPATVVYSVAGVSVNPVLPATGGSVSMLDNVNRATIAVGGSATASGANSTTQSLSRGFTRVLIVVTAEDGTTTQTYSLNVTRLEPNLDTTLKGLVPSSGWLVLKGSSGADGNEKAPSAAFSPSVTTYQVRAVHSIPYLGAVVPNNVTSIAFTPYANASLNGVAPVRITVNGVQVADSAISQHVALSDSSFPAPSVREIPIVVTAEDGSVSTTYTIKVTRAPIQPDPSFWIQFYRLKGGPTESTVDAPATATGAVKYWVTTDYVMPLRLEIDAGLWNSTFYSSMPGLSTNYSPVSGLVFQPVVSVYGSPYKPYGPSVNLPANSTVKNVNFTVNGGTVGEVTVKVTAYGLDVLGSFSYGLEHGFMALSASTLTGEVNLIPGVATFLLEPHDMYGNVILDSKRVYADDEIDAFVCPDISGTTKFPGNGTVPADCKCGVETGCSKPGTGEVARRTDGRYNVFYSVSRSGINFLRMEGSYYYPTPVPSPDVLRGTPLQVKVEGTALGVRSFVETILYRSFRVEEDPGFFFVHARDDFGNDLFEGGQGDRLSVATRPALRDEAGNPISGIVTDVSVPGERGKYRIDLPTTLAAQYEIEVVLNGRFQIAGSGFVLAILPGTFAAENTPYTLPQRIVAGKTTVVQIRATDRYGNWLTFDDYSDYLSASVMQGRFRRRGLLQSYSTLDIPVKISKSPENNYTATFTAPNATSLSYGVWVFAYSYPGKETRTAVSTVPEAFELQPDEPKANMTEFVIPSLGVAGELRLGVRGIDQYGNPSPDGPWRVVATAGPQTVEAELLPKPLDSDPFTQTIDLGAAGLNVSGTYSIRMYLGQQEVTGDVFPASIKVVAGTISSRSAVSSVPSQVTIGTLMTIYIDSLDKYGNRIDVGGEASAIVPYVSNVNDPLDVVPATVMDNRQGSYSITFSPAKSGTFSVALRFNGELKEPLQRFLAIAQSTAASDYTVATSASARAGDVYQEGVGRLVTFTVTPKAGVSLDLVLKSALTATLEFEATGAGRVLPVSPAASSGVRTVSFSETRSGRYRLILRIEGLDLLGSPYTLDILAGLPVDYYVEALPQLSYKAGEETILYMHILDSYGNTIPVDTSTELAVTFEQLPGGEVALGNVESSLVTGYPEGNGAGHKATALLTAAAIYRLSINLNLGLDKMTLCLRRLSSSSAAQGSCLPEITVVPGPAFPPACQLKGSGALPMVAGDQVSLTVISYDKYENTVNRDYAATSLLYKAAMEGPEGGINSTINQFDFYYSPGENVHRAQYSITVAGKYQLDVRKVQPRDEDPADLEGRLHPYTVGSTPLSVTVSPGKMVPSKTFIEPIAKSHVVAQENALHFTLRDAYSNVVTSNTEADVKMIVRGRGVTLTTGQGGEASLEFQPGGTYVVAYTTAIAGEYTVRSCFAG